MEVGFVVLGYIALFSWLAVAGWAKQKRKEREAYYRHEIEKRLIEKTDVTMEQILNLRRNDELNSWLQRREGIKLGGFITTAIGAGIFVGGLFVKTPLVSISAFGLIPLAVGLIVLLYTYVFYPKLSGRNEIPSESNRSAE
jgi:Flp pilus assembly protein TadB